MDYCRCHSASGPPSSDAPPTGPLQPSRERRVFGDRLKAKTGYWVPYREFGPGVRVAARQLAPSRSRGSSADDQDWGSDTGPEQTGQPTQVLAAGASSARAARRPEVFRGRREEPEGTIRAFGGCWPGSARPSPTPLRT